MDGQSKALLVKSIWDLDLTPQTNKILSAYFEHFGLHLDNEEQLAETLFFVELLKMNSKRTKRALEAAISSFRNGQADSVHGVESVQIPQTAYFTREELRQKPSRTDTALTKAIRLTWATHVVTSKSQMPGSWSVRVNWVDDQSFEDVIKQTFPKVGPANANLGGPIKKSKLCARYLQDHANIKLEWTKHLPDHLELDVDRKKLYIFELVSVLEVTKGSPGAAGQDLSACLEKGCFTAEFIVETLMTITLLFPPKDRVWLATLIASRRQWPRWWSKSPARDERLSAPFDYQIKNENAKEYEKYQRMQSPTITNEDLFALYPHWAVRLQRIYEEAEDPTPSSAVGRWADRRKGPRHTYWVTVAAFLLAILFGLAATILGAMQLWVSYCQWKVPEGGHACS